jgi:flavin-dependent dehydrogenase
MDADVLIIGAGPAGLCAALRLLQLGYRVTIVERQTTPPGNLGEAITGGVANILDFLVVSDLLDAVPHHRALPTRLIWSSRTAEQRPANKSVGGMMLARAQFDAALLSRAAARGARCLLPATVRAMARDGEGMQVNVEHGGQHQVFRVRLVLDARGRAAGAQNRIATAPPLLALWCEFDAAGMPAETRVEALADGWLWGAPLPNGRYRVMAFCDPAAPRRHAPSQPRIWLKAALARSHLFVRCADAVAATELHACAATPSISEHAWQDGVLRLGDAAFALDPLSSSGVEKAMRFSLQAATAIHTAFTDNAAAPLAQTYFQHTLIDTAARHCFWTERYYAQAWPAADSPFWQARAQPFPVQTPSATARALGAAHRLLQMQTDRPPSATAIRADTLAHALLAPVFLSQASTWIELPCVVDDRVQLRAALQHPNLERPLAFIEGYDLLPLLQALVEQMSLSTLLSQWSHRMPARTAARIAGWLLNKGVLLSGSESSQPAVAAAGALSHH